MEGTALDIPEHAKRLTPNLTLTLLSIVQALALEVLWSGLPEQPHLWNGGLLAVVGWLQVFALFLGIVVMWVSFVGMVLRMTWVPSVREAVVPFGLGVAEFVLASMLAPHYLVYWLLILAAFFAFATWTGVDIFRAASREPENRELFEKRRFERWDYYGPLYFFVAALMISAALVAWQGVNSWAGVLAVLVANGTLLIQLSIIRHYWNLDLFPARNP